MTIAITSLSLHDADAVIALWHEAGLHPSRSDSEAAIARALAFQPDLFLAAREEGRVVGTVWGAYDGRRGWIYRLAVASSHRRQGLGQRLMDEVEKRLQALGCDKINLLIERDNIAVADFYGARGYRADDVAFMEKWLD